MIFLDSETCGLTGPMVTLQYARDDGPIVIHEIFRSKVKDTIQLIESIVDDTVVGFNMTFDWFHITKIYNILRELTTDAPTINEMKLVEKQNPSRYCLKPKAVVDLMLYARKGPYQSTMARDSIILKKIPRILANDLIQELQKRVEIPDIYFARRKSGYQWDIVEIDDDDFVNIRLVFAASLSLQSLAQDCLGESKGEFPLMIQPEELNYKPYGNNWPEVINEHILTWHHNKSARYYASKDVDITRKLYHYWKPPINDMDSRLAVAAANTRLKGFKIDKSKLPDLINRYQELSTKAPIAPREAYKYLNLNESDRAVIKGTGKNILEALIRTNNQAAGRAKEIQEARKAAKRLELLYKFQQLEIFQPEFKIIGTRSARMSGGNESGGKNINPQGIPRDPEFRELITFTHGYGGDARQFEVTIMDALFKDPKLHEQLLTGKKFHGIIGSKILSISYEDAMTSGERYNRIKNTVFAWAYGAQEKRAAETLDRPIEEMARNLKELELEYPGIGEERARIFNDFCSMRQPNGIGTQVVWNEPKDYVESMLGDRRYFTLENNICRALFNLANQNLFKDIKTRVTRRDRIQTAGGAAASAIYAAAFNIQASNLRQAGNHKVQATGARITKDFQLELDNLQPQGINTYRIWTMNVHDELLSDTDGTVDPIPIKDMILDRYRKHVPLLDWEFKPIKTWKDTK